MKKLKNTLFLLIFLGTIALGFNLLLSMRDGGFQLNPVPRQATVVAVDQESGSGGGTAQRTVISMHETDTPKKNATLRMRKGVTHKVSERTGICTIIITGKTVVTTGYGEQVQRRFRAREAALEEMYGGATETYDLLFDGESRLRKDIYWMRALLQDERILMAQWNTVNQHDIQTINVEAKAKTEHAGYIRTVYTFPTFEACKKAVDIIR